MPLYEFHCTKCDNEFEELCSLSNINSVLCPKCKDSGVERLMSSFAFSSKGNSNSSKGSSCGSCKASSCKSCSK